MVTAANISLLFIRLNIYEIIKQEKNNKLPVLELRRLITYYLYSNALECVVLMTCQDFRQQILLLLLLLFYNYKFSQSTDFPGKVINTRWDQNHVQKEEFKKNPR